MGSSWENLIIELGLKGLITVQMIKSEILSNLFNEKYGLKLGELNNSTGSERVKTYPILPVELFARTQERIIISFSLPYIENKNYTLTCS